MGFKKHRWVRIIETGVMALIIKRSKGILTLESRDREFYYTADICDVIEIH